MKLIILAITFVSLSGCLKFSKDAPAVKSDQKTSQSSDLYFGTQQEPLLTLEYVTVEVVGERIDLETLSKLKITGSNLGNSSEYGGDFIREKKVVKQVRDPKDNYFRIHWETTSGEHFNVNLSANNGVIRL